MLQAERLENPRSGLAGFAPHCPTAQLGGVILITSFYGQSIENSVHCTLACCDFELVRCEPPTAADGM
jgi:hypothetical protein